MLLRALWAAQGWIFQAQWPAKIPAILAAYRMTKHKVTNTTPNFAMLGREVRCPTTLIAAPPEDTETPVQPFNQTFLQNMRSAHEKIRTVTRQVAKTQKNYFDAHVKGSTFTEGQLVWLYHPKPMSIPSISFNRIFCPYVFGSGPWARPIHPWAAHRALRSLGH